MGFKITIRYRRSGLMTLKNLEFSEEEVDDLFPFSSFESSKLNFQAIVHKLKCLYLSWTCRLWENSKLAEWKGVFLWSFVCQCFDTFTMYTDYETWLKSFITVRLAARWPYKRNVPYNFERLLSRNYKDIYYFTLIGCPRLWISNGFDGESISRNKLELLTC